MAGDAGGGLLLTATATPQSWPASLPDLRSRLNAMPVAELPPPDDAVLEGLLKNFFRERNIKPTDDVIPYLLRRIERSAVSARQIVDRLDEAAVAVTSGPFPGPLRDRFLKLRAIRPTSATERLRSVALLLRDNFRPCRAR